MSWTPARTQWSDLIDDLCRDFPQLDATALRRFRGNRSRLVAYLADVHDLTRDEAAETLADWLYFRAAGARHLAA